MAGAAVAKAGGHVLVLRRMRKDGVFIVWPPNRPPIAFIVMRRFYGRAPLPKRRPASTGEDLRRLQLVSACLKTRAMRHDAQRPWASSSPDSSRPRKVSPTAGVPLWVVLGDTVPSLSAPLRRHAHRPYHEARRSPPPQVGGVSAESAAAVALFWFFVSSKGIPVSTTHTSPAPIVGVGVHPSPLSGRAVGRRRDEWLRPGSSPPRAAIVGGPPSSRPPTSMDATVARFLSLSQP